MNTQPLSKQEKLDALDALSMPIDFEELEKSGILKRKGKGDWFFVLKPTELPHHVNLQATELSRSKGEPDCIKVPKLTRSKISSIAKLKKQIQG